MCSDNETAMMQVRAMFVSDPDHWANVLWTALETRFTQETLSQLQTNLILLGKFKADLHNESFKQMIDRFRKLISDVRAIDAAQVPSDTNLLAVLKESIVSFEGLWSQLEFNTPNINLELAMDTISRWRTEAHTPQSEVMSRTVANLPTNPNGKKKAYSKQVKSGNRRPEKYAETRNCLVCKKQGHLVKDCRDPRKEDWIRNHQNRDVRAESRGRSRDKHPRKRSSKQSPSRDKSQSRDNRDRSRERDRSSDSRESRVDRSYFDKSKKAKKSWMSADGDNLNSDEDAANMIGFEYLRGKEVGAAFSAIVGPELVCIDTGCNKLILINIPDLTLSITYEPQEDRWILTASNNGRLDIAGQGFFDNDEGKPNSLTEYRHCPEATANLMPSSAITKYGSRIMIGFDSVNNVEWMRIICFYELDKKQLTVSPLTAYSGSLLNRCTT